MPSSEDKDELENNVIMLGVKQALNCAVCTLER